MKQINRRSFLQSTLLTTAATTLMPLPRSGHKSWRQRHHPVAAVGFGGRGGNHSTRSHKMGVRLGLCDAHQRLDGAKRLADKGNPVKAYLDVRKLSMTRRSTDRHGDSQSPAFAACGVGVLMGKDVYVEKPVSHNVWEGRLGGGCGAQSHRPGGAGAVNEGLRRALIGSAPQSRQDQVAAVSATNAAPASAGPRPSRSRRHRLRPVVRAALKLPLMRQRLHYDWQFGSGTRAMATSATRASTRWSRPLGARRRGSPRILSVGGRFGYIDDGETPNTQFAIHDCGDALLIFEVRGSLRRAEPTAAQETGQKCARRWTNTGARASGIHIECENGY